MSKEEVTYPQALMNEICRTLRNYLAYLDEGGVKEVCLDQHGTDGTDLPTSGVAMGVRTDPHRELAHLREIVATCTKCRLACTRTNVVLGEGDPRARIVFVGEGPGYEEDQTGRPFVGKAGALLTQIIEAGMHLARDEVYICNVVKCRPPENREPQEDEVRACFPFLERQIAIVNPKVIVTLGHCAAAALTGDRRPVRMLRGTWHYYRDIPVMPTYHPAYVLRNYTPLVRRQVWDDVRKVMAMLDRCGSFS